MHTDRPANLLKPNSPSLHQTQCASCRVERWRGCRLSGEVVPDRAFVVAFSSAPAQGPQMPRRVRSVSSARHIEPCVRFSRTRLTDVVHRRHSAFPASPARAWEQQQFHQG